jgi:hypothetical protein
MNRNVTAKLFKTWLPPNPAVAIPAILAIATAIAIAGGGAATVTGQGNVQDLAGVIDIHTHSEPDSTKRVTDVIELAKAAKARGMRGIVIKDHFQTTASVAFLVRKIVPGFEAFGGITMDLSNGGLNPFAVENMAKVSGGWGRVVWMPTFDSEAQVTLGPQPAQPPAQPRPFVRVAKDGALLPETRRVISVIAADHLVLATGHSSATEHLLLVREGERLGLRHHMVVTHAPSTFGGMSVAQMKEAAQAGAFIEICGMSIVGARPSAKASTYADIIRQVGPESVIMSTDLGQPENPLHTDGMAAFIAAMKSEGISQSAIDLMTKKNPAELLGLPN